MPLVISIACKKFIASKDRWQQKIQRSTANIVERLSIERPAPLLGAAIRNTVVVVTALKISKTN